MIHHLRAQQSIKLFLMQIFGRNIFHAKKENHDIKNSFTKSDHAVSEADEETTLLATLKNTALDLGNHVAWTAFMTSVQFQPCPSAPASP